MDLFVCPCIFYAISRIEPGSVARVDDPSHKVFILASFIHSCINHRLGAAGLMAETKKASMGGFPASFEQLSTLLIHGDFHARFPDPLVFPSHLEGNPVFTRFFCLEHAYDICELIILRDRPDKTRDIV